MLGRLDGKHRKYDHFVSPSLLLPSSLGSLWGFITLFWFTCCWGLQQPSFHQSWDIVRYRRCVFQIAGGCVVHQTPTKKTTKTTPPPKKKKRKENKRNKKPSPSSSSARSRPVFAFFSAGSQPLPPRQKTKNTEQQRTKNKPFICLFETWGVFYVCFVFCFLFVVSPVFGRLETKTKQNNIM